MLPRKASKYRTRRPYRKPTQVGGMKEDAEDAVLAAAAAQLDKEETAGD